MNDKLKQYLDNAFSTYGELKSLNELKEELFQNLQEKMQDFKSQGYDDATALQMTIDSIGEISELIESTNASTSQLQQIVGANLSRSNLPDSDLQSVAIHDGKFNASNLKGTDFSNADLTDSTFKRSNLQGVKFDHATLTRANVRASNLKGASFEGSILDGTDFSYSDLSGVSFDGQTLNGTVFNYAGLNGTSFRNATLINVSFKTKVKKTLFDGAIMDKLTYAILKGHGANLQDVTVR